MNFIKENITDRDLKRRGFVLLELILVTSLIGILVTAQIIIISRYMRLHRQEINLSRESFYVNEAFMIIEYQIRSAKYVDAKENRIVLKRFDGLGYDYIRKDKDLDIIISYGSPYSSNTNNILKNTRDFKVARMAQTLNISIEMKDGNVYERCLGLERVKLRGTS